MSLTSDLANLASSLKTTGTLVSLNVEKLNGQTGSFYTNLANSNITLANTQLKSYTDGLVVTSVSSANTQLKSYTDGVIASANTQLKSYTDGAITSANTQLKAYSDGRFSNATNLSAGTVPTSRLGSGTADSSTYLRGDQTWSPIPAATTITNETTSASTYYPLLSTSLTGTLSTANTSSTKLSYQPSTGTLSATKFSGSGASLTSIPNSALNNSSITINGTTIDLGSSGSITAGAIISDDTTTNATRYLMLGPATSGNYTVANTSSSRLFFNPGTGTMNVTVVSSASGGDTTYHLVSAATTNATNLKASAGKVTGWYIYNSNASARKVAFHNTAGTPTAGSSIFYSIVVPGLAATNISFPDGIDFSTGIAITLVPQYT